MQSILSDEHLMGSFGEISYLERYGEIELEGERMKERSTVLLYLTLFFCFLFFFCFLLLPWFGFLT